MSHFEAGFAISIANKILSDVGEPEPLDGSYLEVYNKYCEKIDEDVVFQQKEYGKDTDIEDLETERLHIECFCRFLQESEYKLLK